MTYQIIFKTLKQKLMIIYKNFLFVKKKKKKKNKKKNYYKEKK